MKKLMIILTVFVLLTSSMSFASMDYEVMSLDSIGFVTDDGIVSGIDSITLWSNERQMLVTFPYYDEVDNFYKYASKDTVYLYRFEDDSLVIKYGDEILFNDDSL